MAKSNLGLRLLTAAIGGPIILGILYFGPPVAWFGLLLVAGLAASLEFYAMTHKDDRVAQVVCSALTLGFMALFYRFGVDARILLTAFFLLPVTALVLALWRLGDVASAAFRIAASVFGPIYLGGGLGALALLRRDAGADGPGFIVFTLMLAWLSDTGGYFAGRFLGRRKLYEAVSPKKTVEGSIGGLGGACAGALLAHFGYLRALPLVDGLVLAIVAGGLGQVGDLGESLIKRSVGVKDSGGILPGHGGILDRIDALLVTGALTYAYVVWLR